jgi:hypothetical protein
MFPFRFISLRVLIRKTMVFRIGRYVPRKYFNGGLYVIFVVGLLFYYVSLTKTPNRFNRHSLPANPGVLYGNFIYLKIL